MKRFLAVIVLAVFAALGAGGYLAYQAYTEVFPALPNGLYMGTIEVRGRDPKPLFVDSSHGPRDLVVAIGDDAMPAQRMKTVDASGSAGLPLIITGRETRLRLIGSEYEPGRYKGAFFDPIRNERGDWMLERATPAPLAPEQRQYLQQWAVAYQELLSVERGLSRAYSGAALGSLGGGDAPDLSAHQAELDRAVRNLDLSGRLSDEGLLVQLSRESIQREGRWVEQVLKLEAPETSPSFDEDLARAYQVKGLLDQIATERRLLDERAFQGDEGESYGEEPRAFVDGAEPSAEEGEGFYDDL